MGNKNLISIDCEADGPCPGLYSMVSFGAVVVEPGLKRTFYGRVAPISDQWVAEALAVSGHSRKEHETFDDPRVVMHQFEDWLKKIGPCVAIMDNPAFDWQFINYYFHRFLGKNPLGFSARRIGDLFCGLKGDMRAKWKYLRDTNHDHNPVNDAKGNAEALMKMAQMGIKGIL